jgi:hypothetical protein
MRTAIALGAGAALLLTGCAPTAPQADPTSTAPPADPTRTAAQADPTPNPTVAGTSAASAPRNPLPTGSQPVRLDPAQFSTEIDHPYWPMKPRTRWTYREVEDDEVKEVVMVVTRQTKKLANGITARVVRDTVRVDGSIIEDTFDWYAQDSKGNLWYLGEDTAEFEDGKITSRGGSFEAGRDGALPGIMLPADPAPGMRYRQEYYKGEAEDYGEVLSTAEMAEVPAGRYRGALLTKDLNTIEPDVQEYKLYGKGVGPVLVLGVSGGSGREELIKVDQAPADAGTGPLGRPNP